MSKMKVQKNARAHTVYVSNKMDFIELALVLIFGLVCMAIGFLCGCLAMV